MKLAFVVAIGCYFFHPCRTTAPRPGLNSSVEAISPGATYSEKFFSAVIFSVA